MRYNVLWDGAGRRERVTRLGFIDRWVSRLVLLGGMILGQMSFAPVIPGDASGWFENTIALLLIPIGYGIAFVAARRLDRNSTRPIGPLLRMTATAFGFLFFFFVLIGVLGGLTALAGGTPSPPDSVTALPSDAIEGAFVFLFVTFLAVGAVGLVSCLATARGVRWGAVGLTVVAMGTAVFMAWAASETSDVSSCGVVAFFGVIAVAVGVSSWRHWDGMSWSWFARMELAPSIEQAPPADSAHGTLD